MAWSPSPLALAAITAGVVAAGVGAGVLLQPTRDIPGPRPPNVSIAVVAPREPVPEPGAVMDVGDLADGYSHPAWTPPAVIIPRSWNPPEDPPARVEPRPVERPPEVAPRPTPPPVMAERPERPDRPPLGFDPPGPDYAAERRERRARMEEARRLDEERRFEAAQRAERFDDRGPHDAPNRDRGPRERQWYSSDGRPVPGPGGRD
jgi:hypothetical protein